ncbi:YbaK prolyl-tRNA synthetase associated region [Secundilactobacillus odoratitofui DSM 19909 = JCM 15043]|uniref:YbaK prolyl-tRNA synthetase associated region n=1 Tax=Secundilactobacillus odoratitofui DSM 19909 = JCM 15043 TaxID=1423776 RepID=A0A0R1LQ51_9LACO|nr:prolyl-tRNA synthetase associated domain-containing protein [Secundilactobacillus odoratitofui]KRK97664.1 YbaK prolyl-tRNA synthetase associated region [Secundilactobacillus odoratitofui DSM 19909 = JCM 15043]
MNKEETYQYLRNHGVKFEVSEHQAVFNMGELDSVNLAHPEWDAKNLFIRDDKKRHYYLISVRGDKRVDLKAFRKRYGLRALSFASENDLLTIMGLTPGSVTPLGLLNDADRKVHFYLDAEFAGNLIGVHPNDNTATVWLNADVLVNLIKAHGNDVDIVELNR